MEIKIETSPKFKKGDEVMFLDYGNRVIGVVKEVKQNGKIHYSDDKHHYFSGNGWFYDLQVGAVLYASIAENRLSAWSQHSLWKEKLAKQGINFDEKKVTLSNVYYDTTYTYGTLPIMVTGVSEGNENITVVFKKVKVH